VIEDTPGSTTDMVVFGTAMARRPETQGGPSAWSFKIALAERKSEE